MVEEAAHTAINHVLEKLKLLQLNLKTIDSMAWRRNENFYDGDFYRFVQEVGLQAMKM